MLIILLLYLCLYVSSLPTFLNVCINVIDTIICLQLHLSHLSSCLCFCFDVSQSVYLGLCPCFPFFLWLFFVVYLSHLLYLCLSCYIYVWPSPLSFFSFSAYPIILEEIFSGITSHMSICYNDLMVHLISFRSRWPLQTNRRHKGERVGGLSRNSCCTYLSYGWLWGNCKSFCAARKLSVHVCILKGIFDLFWWNRNMIDESLCIIWNS